MLKSLKAVDDLKNIAINKTKVVEPVHQRSVETTRKSKTSDGQYKLLLERLQSSPDENSLQTLMNFCIEKKATTCSICSHFLFFK